MLDEIHEQNKALHEKEQRLIEMNSDLEQRVVQRTSQLEAANKELEAFSYSVSHDLRAPLRHIAGFVKMLSVELADKASPKSQRFMKVIADAAKQMGQLIDELLVFSKMGRVEMQKTIVDTNKLVEETIQSMQDDFKERKIIWEKADLPRLQADPAMLRQVFVNLISNAVKYSKPRDPAKIEIGHNDSESETVIFVRDNGVGFDMQYADKLFGVFQRLHQADEFEGTGIGLANVRRIVQRHGGRTWAESVVNQGATFYFSLPKLKGTRQP
jgi:light-regulated signal transduction histidine kinase (bacteriophytochrome)